ncbi:MAG: hypothetical protein PHP00_08425 [Thiotrichaceae bacterium]|nr:hypothetical protein [Thiotrichaceae bacterium]
MSIQILENTPDSLKLRSSNLPGFFIGLIFVSIIFLVSGSISILFVRHIILGEKDGFLIGFLSLFFTVIGALGVRAMLLSAHACILHFDQTTKKLNLYPQSIFRKLPVEEIPFAQLEKIELEEKLNTDDDDKDKEYLTYALTLKTKDKFVSTTAKWCSLWSGAKESQRHEVEEMARLISKITGIPYIFSTDKPLPEKS